MYAYCPKCETELDQATGICPACRWDPIVASRQAVRVDEPEVSLTERYRGTRYEFSSGIAAERGSSMSRGRTFVVVGLLAAAGLYGLVLGVTGLI